MIENDFKIYSEAESSGKTIKYILREKLMFSQNLIRKLKRQNGIFAIKPVL